jgi:hypothetical protein
VRTEQLEAAYQGFVAEATAGGFGPPPPGEWTARQLIAHIALNDDLLASAAAQVIAGEPGRFDNSNAADWTKVSAFADEHGGLAGGVEAVRASGARVCAIAGQLTDEQAATSIDVFILDGADVAVDEPMPLGQLLAVQASFHLPAHAEQLRALRPGAGRPS